MVVSSREVALNLWYVVDGDGVIYSLRVKAYAVDGSDEDKLAFLRSRADHDYLIAEPFEIPKRFHVTFQAETRSQKMPVAIISMLDTLDSPIALFKDAIRAIEARFPDQSDISVPDDPLFCMTALMQGADGTIEPKISRKQTS